MSVATPLATHERPDRGALAMLLGTGLVAVAPHAWELPWWVVPVFIVGGAWRYLSEARGGYRPGWLARASLMLVVVAATFRHYHTLLGRDPGLTLLIALLGLKFLELQRLRDYMLCVFLFFLVTLGSFLYQQTLLLGIYALGSTWLSIAALIRLTQPRGLALSGQLKLSATLLAQALPLMLILYLLFPRLPGTLWAMPLDSDAALTGLSDSMQPGSIQQLSESSDTAFRVSFEGKPPPARELYFRALVLWTSDGRGWGRTQQPSHATESFTPQGEAVRYEVVLEPTQKTWLMALDLPGETPAKARARPGFTLEYLEPIRERQRYTLTSYTHYQTGALDPQEREATLQLPKTVSARVQGLADEWRDRDPQPRAIVQAGLDFFRAEDFVYTLTPPRLGPDPVDEFLFSTRRGFCEHYASAYVTLMRAAGIPSRVVLGYLGGEYNAAGNYLIVRQSDAHAWAEVWLPNQGWVRVDPTGAIAPERIELGLEAVRRLQARGTALGRLPMAEVLRAIELGWAERAWYSSRLYWDLLNISWYRWVADYGQERQERLLAALGLERWSMGNILFLSGGIILLLLLVYGLWLWHERARVDPVQAQYLKYCRKLAGAGLRRAPHEGALAFAQRCHAARADLQPAIQDITQQYVRLRYGSARTGEALRQFKHRVASLRAAKN
jgi:transglutaminase-like putative cysteine protease